MPSRHIYIYKLIQTKYGDSRYKHGCGTLVNFSCIELYLCSVFPLKKSILNIFLYMVYHLYLKRKYLSIQPVPGDIVSPQRVYIHVPTNAIYM